MVLSKIGSVAYKLQLPPTAKVHLVFYVSLLKKRIGSINVIPSELPLFDDDRKVLIQSVADLTGRLVKKNNSPVDQLLIQWSHLPESEATWEDFSIIADKCPKLLA